MECILLIYYILFINITVGYFITCCCEATQGYMGQVIPNNTAVVYLKNVTDGKVVNVVPGFPSTIPEICVQQSGTILFGHGMIYSDSEEQRLRRLNGARAVDEFGSNEDTSFFTPVAFLEVYMSVCVRMY